MRLWVFVLVVGLITGLGASAMVCLRVGFGCGGFCWFDVVGLDCIWVCLLGRFAGWWWFGAGCGRGRVVLVVSGCGVYGYGAWVGCSGCGWIVCLIVIDVVDVGG